MTKSSGLGDNLYVAGYNLSGDVGSLSRVGGGVASTLDVTGIDKSAYERIGGVRDGSIGFNGFMNTASGQEHDALKTLPRTDVHVMYCRGTALGSPAACMVARQGNYDWTRGTDGSLTFTVDAQANGYGLEWSKLHTAGLRTDTTATNGTSVDGGAAGTNGGQFWLQVTALTGTNVVVTVQESSDNGVGDAWASLVAFTSVTSARTCERKTVAGNMERYLRVVTSGVFASATFVVACTRNLTAVTF